jgi:hypothetical protein
MHMTVQKNQMTWAQRGGDVYPNKAVDAAEIGCVRQRQAISTMLPLPGEQLK